MSVRAPVFYICCSYSLPASPTQLVNHAYAALQLFLDRKGNRQALVLQPCTGRASAAQAFAFQHCLALARVTARQQVLLLRPSSIPTSAPRSLLRPAAFMVTFAPWEQDALVAKEKQKTALEVELRNVEAQLTRDVEDRTKKDEKLIASVRRSEPRFSACM